MEINITNTELNVDFQPTVIEFEVDLHEGIQGVQTVTSSDSHIQVDDTDPKNPVLSFTLVDNENLLTDDELAVVRNTSGTNTGDQDLSGYELTSNKKTTITDSDTDYPTTKAVKTALAGKSADFSLSLANLTERSYNSLTDKPNLDAYIDIIEVQFWQDSQTNEPDGADGDIWYSLDYYVLYVYIDNIGWLPLPFCWKFYLNKDANSDFFGKYFVYNGTELSIIPDGLVLGETSQTAFDGLRGKAAYDHANETGNPHGLTIGDIGAADENHNHTIGSLTDVDLTETTPLETDSVLIEQTTTGKVKKSLFSTIVTFLSSTFGALATANTWALLQTFTSGIKTGLFRPIADATNAIRLTKADGVTDVMVVDTANGKVGIGKTPSELFDVFTTNQVALFELATNSQNGYSIFKLSNRATGQSRFWKFIVYGKNESTVNRLDFNCANTSKTPITLLDNGNVGLSTNTPETTLDINGTTTLRDWVYLNNGTHTGDVLDDYRYKVLSGVLTFQKCTTANSVRGNGGWTTVSTI